MAFSERDRRILASLSVIEIRRKKAGITYRLIPCKNCGIRYGERTGINQILQDISAHDRSDCSVKMLELV